MVDLQYSVVTVSPRQFFNHVPTIFSRIVDVAFLQRCFLSVKVVPKQNDDVNKKTKAKALAKQFHYEYS